MLRASRKLPFPIDSTEVAEKIPKGRWLSICRGPIHLDLETTGWLLVRRKPDSKVIAGARLSFFGFHTTYFQVVKRRQGQVTL